MSDFELTTVYDVSNSVVGYHNMTVSELHNEALYTENKLAVELMNRESENENLSDAEKWRELEASKNGETDFPFMDGDEIYDLITKIREGKDGFKIEKDYRNGDFRMDAFNEDTNVYHNNVRITDNYAVEINYNAYGEEFYESKPFATLKEAKRHLVEKMIHLVCRGELNC